MARKHRHETETAEIGETATETNTMTTASITIQKHQFTVPQPFTEGHVVTAGEASALNQVFAENLRNNFAKKVKTAVDDGTFEHEVLQSQLTEYAENYQFGVRVASTKPHLSQVEKKTRDLAAGVVKAKLTARGLKLSQLAEGQFDRLVSELIEKRPELRAEAERQVEMQKAIADEAMAEIEVEVAPAEAAAAAE